MCNSNPDADRKSPVREYAVGSVFCVLLEPIGTLAILQDLLMMDTFITVDMYILIIMAFL